MVGNYMDGLVQDCSNPSALAMELLQSCTKPSILLNDCQSCYVEWNIHSLVNWTWTVFGVDISLLPISLYSHYKHWLELSVITSHGMIRNIEMLHLCRCFNAIKLFKNYHQWCSKMSLHNLNKMERTCITLEQFIMPQSYLSWARGVQDCNEWLFHIFNVSLLICGKMLYLYEYFLRAERSEIFETKFVFYTIIRLNFIIDTHLWLDIY